MKKFVSATAAGAVALLAAIVPSASSAQTWSPAPADGYTLSGNIDVEQSIKLNCDVTGRAKTTGSNTGEISSLNFAAGDTLCSLLGENTPWAIEPISASTVRVHVNVTALWNNCSGYFDANYSSGTLTLPSRTLVVGSSPSCWVGPGSITLTPDAGVAPLVITP